MVLPGPVAAALVPFLVAFGAAGVLRRRPVFGAVAIPLGALAGFAIVAGGLPLLGNVPHHRLGEVLVAAIVAAPVLACFGDGTARWRAIAIWAALAAVGWVFGPDRIETMEAADAVLAAVFAAAAVVGLLRLSALGGTGALPVVMVAGAAAGLAAIAWGARAALTTEAAAALAASCLGWLVWARPFAKAPSGIAALAAGASLAALAVEVERTALHAPWPMVVLFACFWPEWIAARLPGVAARARRRESRAAALGIASLLPAAAASALAVATRLAGPTP
jgi:hypothetical protein